MTSSGHWQVSWAMSDSRKALLILGMHRSGTSLLTGLIANAGVSIGQSVMTPAEDNPKGFFENQRIVDFNEKLLNALKLGWASWEPLPESWLASLESRWFDEAGRILDEEFGGSGAVCIKDPRMCRLLPFWRQVFSSQNFEPYCVFTTRQLDEVSASLQKRDGMGKAQADATWLRYNLDAMQASGDLRGIHLSYEDVLENPAAALDQVSELVGEPFQVADPGFADTSLRHHRLPDAPAWAQLVRKNCEEYPAAPDEVLETQVYPLVAGLAEQERRFGEAQSGEVSVENLTSREAVLFNQAEEAKQHAISLSRELETGRQYITDLEREHQQKDELIQSQEASLQEAKERFETSMAENQAYAETLKESIEQAETYSKSLELTIDQKDADMKAAAEAFEKDIQQREEYTGSVVSELERKESELVSAHGELEKMHLELQSLHRELAETHQRLIDRTNELEEELKRFRLQRKMIKMMKRVTDG